MLEKPAISDDVIIACLRDTYDLAVTSLEFLPIGADQNTAVYRATTNETAYFIKLRSGDFDKMTVLAPKHLYDAGIGSVIPPLPTSNHALWVAVDDFKLAVSPYVNGYNGYEGNLSNQHWIEFGRALKALHTTPLPTTITNQIQRETFTDKFRNEAQAFLTYDNFQDKIGMRLSDFLTQKQSEIHKLIQGAGYLASVLKSEKQDAVLCHADIHAGNVLIDADDNFYIVDWDTLILAPKERDLMYVGGGQFVNHRTPEEETHLFYQGYGQADVNPIGIVYYRYERIVQDIVAYCEAIFLGSVGNQDRENGLHQLMSQFEAGGVVQIAFDSARQLPSEYQIS
jgi:spectinomycin phosphotransferase